MAKMNEEEFEMAEEELKKINYEIRTLQRRTAAKYRDCLTIELEEAIKKQRHALAHRLVRQLAGTGIGVKHRLFLHTQAYRPDKDTLKKNAEAEANKGGLSARVKEPDEYCQELAELAMVQT